MQCPVPPLPPNVHFILVPLKSNIKYDEHRICGANYPLAIQSSYWTWQFLIIYIFIVDFPIKHGDFPWSCKRLYQAGSDSRTLKAWTAATIERGIAQHARRAMEPSGAMAIACGTLTEWSGTERKPVKTGIKCRVSSTALVDWWFSYILFRIIWNHDKP